MTTGETRLRFGLAVPHGFGDAGGDGPSVDDWLPLLEAPVVDSLWVLDQLVGRAPTAEALVLLGLVAAHTTRVRLGPAVLVGPARGPLATAKSLSTIDRSSGGRLVVGIGLGAPHHYPTYGLDRSRGGAGDALDELLLLLRRLWTEDTVTHAGRWWVLDEASVNPKPLQVPHPPIWIGGGSDRALGHAVTVGSGWIGAGRHSSTEFADGVTRLRRLLGQAGRAEADVTIAKRVYVHVAARQEEADAVVAAWFGEFYGRPELGAAVTVAGDVEACAEQLAALAAAGADELILHPLVPELSQYELVVGDVIPALAGVSPARS